MPHIRAWAMCGRRAEHSGGDGSGSPTPRLSCLPRFFPLSQSQPAAAMPAPEVSGAPVTASVVKELAAGYAASAVLLLAITVLPPFVTEAYAPGILRVPARYRRHSGLPRGWQGRAVSRRALPTARGSGGLPC